MPQLSSCASCLGLLQAIDPNCPAGHKLLPEKQRLETLGVLKHNLATLMDKTRVRMIAFLYNVYPKVTDGRCHYYRACPSRKTPSAYAVKRRSSRIKFATLKKQSSFFRVLECMCEKTRNFLIKPGHRSKMSLCGAVVYSCLRLFRHKVVLHLDA